jgi:hypothetical protein
MSDHSEIIWKNNKVENYDHKNQKRKSTPAGHPL